MVEKVELIFISLPLSGHLPAIIEFAKRLSVVDLRIQMITILTMKLPSAPHSDAYARSLAASLPTIQLIDLPDIEDPPPMELLKASPQAYIYAFVEKSVPLVRKTIAGILSSRCSDSVRVTGLILDLFSVHLTLVGDELSLPCYMFLTSGANFLSLMKYLPERHSMITSEFDKNSKEELSIPGYINPVPSQVLPPAIFNKDGYDAHLKLGERFANVKGILVNTFAELEPYCLEYFGHQDNYPPVYPLGPVLNLKGHQGPGGLDPAKHVEIMKWLDDQPESSVLFVCFGSMGRLSALQAREIALGLEFSGYKFLWCLRAEEPPEKEGPDTDGPVPKELLDRIRGQGMICDWAPQVDVLAHKAVGGFVSHCGWNSILESVWHGVPILTWPMYAEQQLNAFTMVKELGLAVEMRLDYRARDGELVMADEIARAVQRLMNDDVVRKKMKEMAEAGRKAVMDGGSSFIALERFTQDMIGSSNF